MNENRVLFVDLDGTLIKEDLSNLAFSHSLKNYPLKTLFYTLVFLFKGKPYLKYKISKNFEIPFKNLTFNTAAFNFIREVKNRHRVVYLISGSHKILVDQIGKYLNIFFESFGTRKNFNMVGSNKIKFIKENLKINDLLKADEIFMTGTAAEVKSVTRVNKTKIGDGKMGDITKELQESFMDTVMGRNKKFRSWLKFI